MIVYIHFICLYFIVFSFLSINSKFCYKDFSGIYFIVYFCRMSADLAVNYFDLLMLTERQSAIAAITFVRTREMFG